jgi:hypothetical protein
MPASTTVPVMAGLAILGAAIGVNLGRSAVAEINPAYFNEAEDTFQADLSANQSPGWAQQAQYIPTSQPVLVGDLGSGCVGCRDYPVEYVPVHDPAVDVYADSGSDASTDQAAASAASPAPARDPAMEMVARYSSYPVSADEQAAQARAAQAPAAEPEKPAEAEPVAL